VRNIDGLRHKIEGALFHGFDCFFDGSERRHEQDGNCRVGLFLYFENLQTRERGQPQIGDHKLVRLFPDFFGRDVAVRGFIHLITRPFYCRGQHLSQAVLVFYKENFHTRIISVC